MHRFLFLGIPAKNLSNGFKLDSIRAYVKKVMREYAMDTADEENVKCDYYEIGGRWQGVFAAKKDSKNIILTDTGMFEENYDFFPFYDALVNDGANGPYIIDDVEYVPVNGGFMSDIDLEVVNRFREYRMYLIFKSFLDGDSRVGNAPDTCRITEEGIYFTDDSGEERLMLKKGETFAQFTERMEIKFVPDFIPPHAYIDLDGVWHDENDVWDNIQAELLSGKFPALDIMEIAREKFAEMVYKFMKGLNPEDGLVVVDYHV